VYRATDTVLGREVAVKVLQEKYAPDSGTARRFADEARIAGDGVEKVNPGGAAEIPFREVIPRPRIEAVPRARHQYNDGESYLPHPKVGSIFAPRAKATSFRRKRSFNTGGQ